MKRAVQNALESYAAMLGVTVAEAIELYKKHASTREAIGMLVLAQANPNKLRQLTQP